MPPKKKPEPATPTETAPSDSAGKPVTRKRGRAAAAEEPEAAVSPPTAAPDSCSRIFHDFDFNGFWVQSAYSNGNYREPALTTAMVQQVEAKLGYKLPEAYIQFCTDSQNGGTVKRTKKPTGRPWPNHACYITGIAGIGKSRPYSLLGSRGSQFWIKEWHYPAIGVYFADCPSGGHDMLCLDYSKCGPRGEPAVMHVNQKGGYRRTPVAKNFEEFVRGLAVSKSMGVPQDDPPKGAKKTRNK